MIKKYDNTSITAIDDIIAGLHCGDLAILAVQPDTDKTDLAVNISINAAQQKTPVAVFSMETPKEHLCERILLTTAGISDHTVNTDNIQLEQWDIISKSIKQISEYPIYMTDAPVITADDMEKAICHINDDSIDLMVIDNLQLMYKDCPLQEVLGQLKTLAQKQGLIITAIISHSDYTSHITDFQCADKIVCI